MSSRAENLDFILRSRTNLHSYENSIILESQDSTHVVISNPYSESHFGSKLQFNTCRGDLHNNGYLVNREFQIPIHGCLGVIRLLAGWYVIVITERVLVGTIHGSEIYMVSKANIFGIPGMQRDLTEEEKNVQKNYITGLNNLMQSSGFYYSPNFDIFNSFQKKSTFNEQQLKEPLYTRIEERFFWNRHVLQQFIENQINDWIIPMMDGFIRIEPSNVNQCLFDYILISRRDCMRTGARFITRGADNKGNVANFVESEQIVIFNGMVSSWVETRGSIPLLWTQSGKSLKSKPEVTYSPFLRGAFQSHLTKQMQLYGNLVLLSLIDQKGAEQEIGEAYETLCRLYEFQGVKYVAYDFHEQCKNNNYSNLDKLVELLSNDLMTFSYYAQDINNRPLNYQRGVIRTNCIDCLDRTGVVQSKLARYILSVQLTAIGIFLPNDRIEDHVVFQTMLNNLWTDNADTMSKRYTGVGALKTDFTRTGKRSATGAVADGVKSVSRLYQSAFFDDEKQVSLDLFLGITILERPIKYTTPQTSNAGTTYRFKTVITNQEGKSEYVFFEFVEHSQMFTIYFLDSCSSQFYHTNSIVQVSRSATNYNLVILTMDCTPLPKKVSFSSTEKREKFITTIELLKRSQSFLVRNLIELNDIPEYQSQTMTPPRPQSSADLIDLSSLQITPSLSSTSSPNISNQPLIPDPSPSPLHGVPPPVNRLSSPSLNTFTPHTPPITPPETEEKIAIYIGSCNLNATSWDVYPSFAECIPPGQDIYVLTTQNYNIPQPYGYYFSGICYWMLSLQLFFGPNFEVVNHGIANKVGIIIFVRKDLVWKINNPAKSSVTIVEPSRSEPKSEAAKGIGSFFKAITKEVQKNLSDSHIRPYSKSSQGTVVKDPNEYVGVAVSFYFNDTSFCFVASKKFNNPYRVLELDILNSFHHVFFIGDIAADFMQFKWGQLVAQQQYGSIFIRNLIDNTLQNVLAPKELNPAWAFPLSVCFNVPTLLPFQYKNKEIQIVISISDLRGHDIYVGEKIFDPYLLVHAPFLAKTMRTTSKKRSWSPEWNELLVLKPLFDDVNMLKKRHIYFEVLDQEEGFVIGVGYVPLKDAFDNNGEPVPFRTVIASFEEPRGFITGKISART